MTSVTSSPSKQPAQSSPYLLDIPDDDSQRGRKRRRSSAADPPMHLTSNRSTTLRGRARHRPLSASSELSNSSPRSRQDDQGPKEGEEMARKSPGKKYQKKGLAVGAGNRIVQDQPWSFGRAMGRSDKGRRSQSLSRSREREGEGVKGSPKLRRRQRTRTRSRSHGHRSGGASGGRGVEESRGEERKTAFSFQK
ncbi:uncharacterized protein L3040_001921 [Drepanopeziza brunnea f. sp. 'multigermtubi']|uniref:Uncharacterized protein n=1 Tax=Marssonina brunnea f. sp. multigermtubi (strain MB_m1) TaxID=1072389 RepID=K1X3Z7_MARBU|nr:uncharacterized protein MBM_01684 [Drepanopeziza brunnea f. sp. 'multigermtubi' MB_m1]EKD19732.1 hypothetical protein MBM_01684 [Drepanopeziza brunnea f. sp. 'multigermtubi' MB_m1]KAJ5052162.1 hypothetical protein L3040_001921 [Drepanopeziza brunnea f. sp. 'multigermtubi']